MLYIILAVGLAVAAAAVLIFWRRRRPINTNRFQEGWRELQKLLRDKTTWPQAITNADKLLDEALKKRRFGGKTMGERMVKAQRIFSDNDGVWFGHKLRSKIEAEPEMKLKEDDVKDALIGIRQGLKDLGALPDGKKNPDDDK
ncbi:MAG: hypothetical protein ACQR33_02415 [Candidatus Saccharibacteria bacterium]